MRLQVNYKTRYDYRLAVDRVPDGLEEHISIEVNACYQVWFSGETRKLGFDSSFPVDVRPFNPFSFIIDH